jgi:hypothetical protein
MSGAGLVRSLHHVPDTFAQEPARISKGGVENALKTGHFRRWRGGRVVEGAPLLRDDHSAETLDFSIGMVTRRVFDPAFHPFMAGRRG